MAINDIQSFSLVAASNPDIAGANIAEGCAPAGINNALRALGVMLRQAIANQGSDKAAATTTSIAETGTSVYAKITGTTTITSFGTPDGNPIRWIQWGAATPVTYDGTSMILRGGASKTYAAGDISCFVHEGSGNWRELSHDKADGTPIASGTTGKHKLWIPAGAMRPDTSAGPDSADVDLGNIQMYALDFDQTTQQQAWFTISMPSSADETVAMTFVPVWTAASGSGGVTWTIFSWARGNDDAITDAGFPSAASSADTLIATGDLHRGPESGSITPDDTWAANDTVFFTIIRNVGDGSDTLTADARLLGIELYITTDAAVDVA